MLIPDPEPDDPWRLRLKLLDFGVAKLLSSRPTNTGSGTHNTMVLGTPEYMSPEQCRQSSTVTDKADVYSLGIILYEMLSGRVPFESESMTEVMAKHMYEPMPPIGRFAPDVPGPLVEILERMLEKQPEKRPSMEKLLSMLENAVSLLFRRSGITTRPKLPIVVPTGEVATQHRDAPTSATVAGSTDGVPSLYHGRFRGLVAAIAALGLLGLALAMLISYPAKVPSIASKGATSPSTLATPTPTAPPQAAATVHWTLVTEPPGAQVIRVDTEEVLGITPWQSESPRGIGALVVRVQLRNYESRIIPLYRSQDLERHEVLQPQHPPAAKKPSVAEEPTADSAPAKPAKPLPKAGKRQPRIEEPEVEE